MNLINKIGKKVVNRIGEIGEIINIDGNYIKVKFPSRSVDFLFSAFENGYLSFVDVVLQSELESELKIKAIEEAEENEKKRKIVELVIAERKRIQEEEERKKRDEATKRANGRNKEKKSESIHPYIDERRNAGKPAIFLVCQNDTYDAEVNGGYIWAPERSTRASHAELERVRKGDIIIHHFDNNIHALSVAQEDYTVAPAGPNHSQEGINGRYVTLSYHVLTNAASTASLKKEKISYGSYMYGPFEVTGKNKEGFYLSECADKLAELFIDACIDANPTDMDLLVFKSKI